MKPIQLLMPGREQGSVLPESAPRAESRINILLVDDQPANLLALEALLTGDQFSIVKASSGAEALRLMLKHDFALVLLDVLMPNMDGFETAELMRLRSQSKQTPIIFITAANSSDTQTNMGYSLGAVDYIYKPIVPEILKAKVQVFADLYRKTEKLARSEEALRRELIMHKTAQEALRRSEERYHTIIEGVQDYAIVSMDKDGHIETLNKGGERLTGYQAREIIGRHVKIFYPQEDQRRELPQILLKRAADQGRVEFEGWRVRKDGTQFWGHIVITALKDPSGRLNGFVNVSRDMTESKKTEEIERLRDREAMQRQLVATVSHELRTPIAAIKLSAETLRDGVANKKTQPRFISIIENHANRLGSLVEDLLTVAELEAGKIHPDPKGINLADFTRQFVADIAPLAARKNVSIQVNIDEALKAWVDQTHLTRIFQNLIDNAIKYNKKKGSISVEAKNIPNGEVQISIKDTGIGIAPEDLPFIFQQFHRTKKARTLSVGTGLGIYIIRTIVNTNNGRIWAESSKKKGSVFHFTLPSAPPAV